jgi:aspartate aminotransferase
MLKCIKESKKHRNQDFSTSLLQYLYFIFNFYSLGKMDLARRVSGLSGSATFKYAGLAGKPGVINLTIGRPDYDTPKVIKEACKTALDEGKVHYTPTKGIPELRAKISEKLSLENNIKGVDADRVFVSGGAKQVLYNLFMSLVDDGDVVALPDPSWVSYEPMIALSGGRVEWLKTYPKKGFVPDEEYLSSLEDSGAKITLINSPNNPTGAFYPKKIIDKIVDVCERKGMWLVSDEVYECFAYEGRPYSPGSRYEKTITVNAFSKTFSMTGWRLGYAACPNKEVINAMNNIQEQSLSCPTSFAQYGALAAFTEEAKKESERMASDFKKRRDYCMKKIEGNARILCKKPGGAFYLYPYFEGWDDVALCEKLLEKGLGTIPGSAFGDQGKGCLRLSYGSASTEKLDKAFNILSEVLC